MRLARGEEEALKKDVVIKQLEMLRFRTTFPAFAFDAHITVAAEESNMTFTWQKEGYTAQLRADLAECSYEITGSGDGKTILIR